MLKVGRRGAGNGSTCLASLLPASAPQRCTGCTGCPGAGAWASCSLREGGARSPGNLFAHAPPARDHPPRPASHPTSFTPTPLAPLHPQPIPHPHPCPRRGQIVAEELALLAPLEEHEAQEEPSQAEGAAPAQRAQQQQRAGHRFSASAAQSCLLYEEQGMPINEVAAMRAVKQSTVIEHLVAGGEVAEGVGGRGADAAG